MSYTNARLVGAIAALVIGYWQKNLLLTIVMGMLVFFSWQWLLATFAVKKGLSPLLTLKRG